MERSTVYCTNCTGEFLIELDLSLNGNHQITCPLCQHIHYRVVKDGVVTEDRWRSSAGPLYFVNTSISNVSVTYGNFIRDSWLNRSDTTYSWRQIITTS